MPINNWLDENIVDPVPPVITDIVPVVILSAFIPVKPVPDPTKLVADKILLSQVKLAVCNRVLEPFPINNWFDINVVVPIPPWATFNIPLIILLAFNPVIPVPEPI